MCATAEEVSLLSTKVDIDQSVDMCASIVAEQQQQRGSLFVSFDAVLRPLSVNTNIYGVPVEAKYQASISFVLLKQNYLFKDLLVFGM